MSSRDELYWFAIALGLVLILSFGVPISDKGRAELQSTVVEIEQNRGAQFAYIPHNPIYIDQNSDFPFYATAGDGSSGNPWVIENLEINSNNTDTPCIYIRDTTDYFVIRNCNLTGASVSPGAGVSLYNVWYGEISNNTITNNRFGIFLDSTLRINMINNTCNNNYYGIYLYDNSWYNDMINNTCNSNYAGIFIESYCRLNTITEATCNGNTFFGIRFADMSSDNDVTNSTFSYNYFGFYASDSTFLAVSNSKFEYNNGDGLYGIRCGWMDVVDNNCTNNNDYGIFIDDSNSNYVSGNNASNNGNRGILIFSSDDCILINNTCNDNTYSGIWLNSAVNTEVTANSASGNNYHGIYLQSSPYSIIENNNFSFNDNNGMNVETCLENTISDNICNNNQGSGMVFSTNSEAAVIFNNTCNNNRWHGIHLGAYTNEFNVTHNTCSNNDNFVDSRGIMVNSITINHTMMWNIFEDNTQDAGDDQNPAYDDNVYDYNFYSDYTGVDSNNDSIGDTPHTISGTSGHNDPHPLMYHPTTPTWDETPTDQTITEEDLLYYNLNATSQITPLTWSVNDTAYFTIDENGTLESLGTLDIGEYGLTVIVKNAYNISIQAEFTITVLDITAPTFNVSSPVMLYYEFGEPFYYDLNASDPSGIDSWWFVYGNVDNLTIDADGVITNATIVYEPGAAVIVTVNDTCGNEANMTIGFFVDDSILPSWVESPENQVIEYGWEFRYDVNATDLAGIDSWWLNSTDFTIDAKGVIKNATILVEGIYGLEIFVEDRHGNMQSTTISVTVEDTVLPSWVISPENQIIEFGENFIYDLDATDLSGISHWWVNSSEFSINADGTITNASVLAVGIYGLEIFVEDNHGNVQSAIITVTVEEVTPTTTTTTPTPTTTTPTDTTTPTSPTTPTGTTPSGLDPMVFIALGGIGAIAVLIIIVVFVKKKS
jgi:parallel beta-helix repeat protein